MCGVSDCFETLLVEITSYNPSFNFSFIVIQFYSTKLTYILEFFSTFFKMSKRTFRILSHVVRSLSQNNFLFLLISLDLFYFF